MNITLPPLYSLASYIASFYNAEFLGKLISCNYVTTCTFVVMKKRNLVINQAEATNVPTTL